MASHRCVISHNHGMYINEHGRASGGCAHVQRWLPGMADIASRPIFFNLNTNDVCMYMYVYVYSLDMDIQKIYNYNETNYKFD